MESEFMPLPSEDSGDVYRSTTIPTADDQCGIGRFKPKWLQRFADPKVYLVIFCIVGVLEGAYFTYFVGVLTTLEKRFAFESKISGIILIADNISAAVISLAVGYYGGKGHKPKMIAFGMVMVSVSCFVSAIPYFKYGPALHFLSQETFGPEKRQNLEYCEAGIRDEDCDNPGNASHLPAIYILFFGNFLCGFGYSAYYTIGVPYLDDNVKKKNSPLYFSRVNSFSVNIFLLSRT
ncbi:hypothetical protein JTE90_020038 [Oedothorax gibbosus]|uniref:Solute carrier organic anion transporter family member 4A1 n=1 Tax=Oedothorax gibbosus TaxID=931172 RepID=A0AAV6UU40_9ARAC|nr:hypothetical protein JTE90_020038 [Oedothorax gibbosus]